MGGLHFNEKKQLSKFLLDTFMHCFNFNTNFAICMG